MKNALLIGLTLCSLWSCTTSPKTYQAAVVSAHPLASEVGAQVLRDGGNAVDAAIATQFALAVVYPIAGNIGGGGFMLYRDSAGLFEALDFRETAPQAAGVQMFQDSTGEVIEGMSLNTQAAVGVPGTVAGMYELHQKHGSLPWEDLLRPAIHYAERGFHLTEKQAAKLHEYGQGILERNESNCVFCDSSEWIAGQLIIQADLAQTLKRISADGPAGFYAGPTAKMIVEEMADGNGIMTASDLADYKAVWRQPVKGSYKGYDVYSMSPPSSGGIALLQMLTMLEAYDIAATGHNSAPSIHLMTEVQRVAYADRAEHLGDPDFYNVPAQHLLDVVYLRNRMGDFDPLRAKKSLDVAAGNFDHLTEETTHFSIVDEMGNAVSLTTTLNGAYGSKIMVDGAGFFLNNEMDDFSAKPGVPNQFGLVGDSANAVEAGKRMLSSMSPTIIERKGQLYMVLGTPGGSTIITSVFQNFLNVVEHGMDMQTAVNAKRVHHQWKPDLVYYEAGAIDSAVINELIDMGHTPKLRKPIGKVDAIRVLDNGRLETGADPRGDDAAAGY